VNPLRSCKGIDDQQFAKPFRLEAMINRKTAKTHAGNTARQLVAPRFAWAIVQDGSGMVWSFDFVFVAAADFAARLREDCVFARVTRRDIRRNSATPETRAGTS